jgi:Ca2+-binding RTX toxin-like protein
MPGTTSISGGGDQLVTVFGKGSLLVGGGNDTINITGHGHLTVGGGNDWLTLGGGGSITEFGNSGNDTITLGAANDTINIQGMATISGAWGSFGSATLSGGELDVSAHGSTIKADAVSGSATLLGGLVPTEFVAGSGFTSLMGGSAADTFIGGSGVDTMTGGTGTNLFEFDHASKGGISLITNFVSGSDTLYLDGHSLSFLQSKGDITTSGGNTFISLNHGATSIELKGFTGLSSTDVTTHKP